MITHIQNMMKGGDRYAVSSWKASFWWASSYASAWSSSSAYEAVTCGFPVLMLCRKPFVQGMHSFGCGQCMPCRVAKRRIWTHRIMLESLLQKDNAFITLTYDDLSLPMNGSLVPKHLQDWLKRLRKLWEPRKLRFYAVGEYGDVSWRPHYHVALFGFPACAFLRPAPNCGCVACVLVRKSWNFGFSYVGTLETHSAQYVAGYVTKKLTTRGDPRLKGKHPEFARMSLRPGVGALSMDQVATVLQKFNLEDSRADVPSVLRHGTRLMPLGRYLKLRLRKAVGKEGGEPVALQIARSLEMHPMYKANVADPSRSVSKQLAEAADAKVRSMEARQHIFKKGKPL